MLDFERDIFVSRISFPRGNFEFIWCNLRHILQSIHNKSWKGIMLPVEGPAAVDTRESCRQVHQVKGSVSGDVISNSLIQQEILEMSRNLEISRNGFEILQKFTMAQMI